MIITKDFILRHITMSDLNAYYECQQDKLTKKAFMHTINSKEEAKEELKEKIQDNFRKNPFGELFAIEINGKFAGYIELHHLNIANEEFKGEIGYCTHPDFRRKNIASKAVKLITDYAFKKYKLKRITAICRTFNKPSARVLKKAGYKLEGILRKNKFKNKEYLDDMIWAKVR